MRHATAGRRRLAEWSVAVAAAAAVTLYLVRHRSLLSELPRLLEALF